MLTIRHEALVTMSAQNKPSELAHTCNPTTQKVEARKSETQGRSWLMSSRSACDTWDQKKKPQKPIPQGPFFSACSNHRSRRLRRPSGPSRRFQVHSYMELGSLNNLIEHGPTQAPHTLSCGTLHIQHICFCYTKSLAHWIFLSEQLV